jgi:hypothetical protein
MANGWQLPKQAISRADEHELRHYAQPYPPISHLGTWRSSHYPYPLGSGNKATYLYLDVSELDVITNGFLGPRSEDRRLG